MLIRFTVSNFLSFKEETEFSMIPAHGSGKSRHVISSGKSNGTPLLQSGIIYGANAAGKSNIIKAMSHGRRMIVHSVDKEQRLPDFRFKLDKEKLLAPTSFEFEIRLGEKNYAYGFTFNPVEITEEWLCEIGKKKDTEIFSRTGQTVTLNRGSRLFKAKKIKERLEFIADDLFPNQLFLTMVNNRNI